jgi:hypothetical protein
VSRASQRLLEIDDAVSSAQVAVLIADYLLESDRIPYCFSIDHNVGPPRYTKCPVQYHWGHKKTVGILSTDLQWTRGWITEALLAGYTVSRVDRKHRPDGPASNIEAARRRAATHRTLRDLPDDDIPF